MKTSIIMLKKNLYFWFHYFKMRRSTAPSLRQTGKLISSSDRVNLGQINSRTANNGKFTF